MYPLIIKPKAVAMARDAGRNIVNETTRQNNTIFIKRANQ
jgi:hypothetical protein